MLAKAKLNSIEVLRFNVLIDSYISQDELISINNALKEYDKINEKIKNLNEK